MTWRRDFWLRWGRYWLPVVLWMGVIFVMSAQPKSVMPTHPVNIIDWFIKKLAHAGEYGLLALLLWRAVGTLRKLDSRSQAWIVMAVCLVYAASDETHQLFVPGRGAAVRDVLIDVTAAGLALGLMSLLLTQRVRNPSWFRRHPWLDRLVSGFRPLRSTAQNNPSE